MSAPLSARQAMWIMPTPCSPIMASLESSSSLANDENYFAIAVALGIGKCDVGREGNVTRHFFPEKAELIAGIPDVVTRRGDGVLLRGGIVAGVCRGRLRHQCQTDPEIRQSAYRNFCLPGESRQAGVPGRAWASLAGPNPAPQALLVPVIQPPEHARGAAPRTAAR